jgi:hypothetical protein
MMSTDLELGGTNYGQPYFIFLFLAFSLATMRT